MFLKYSSGFPELVVSQEDGEQTKTPFSKFKVVKGYPARGELTLYCLSSSTTFLCGRCNKEKKAKLIATYQGQWDDLCCNNCYGQLLSKT